MVHGAFCGGWIFDDLRGAFEAAGYPVLTPDLRGHGRGDPMGAAAGVSMSDYAGDIAKLCAAQGDPPILLGHSMGGLVAQMAARRGPARAVVLLGSSPPWGISGSSVEETVTAFGVQMLGGLWAQTTSADPTLMRTYSLDRLDKAARDEAVARMRPESGRAVWETLSWWLDPYMTTSLGPGPLTQPSLVMVGARDVVHPPATARQIAERLGGDYREWPQMSHWLPSEPGWEAVAEAALDWLDGVKG